MNHGDLFVWMIHLFLGCNARRNKPSKQPTTTQKTRSNPLESAIISRISLQHFFLVSPFRAQALQDASKMEDIILMWTVNYGLNLNETTEQGPRSTSINSVIRDETWIGRLAAVLLRKAMVSFHYNEKGSLSTALDLEHHLTFLFHQFRQPCHPTIFDVCQQTFEQAKLENGHMGHMGLLAHWQLNMSVFFFLSVLSNYVIVACLFYYMHFINSKCLVLCPSHFGKPTRWYSGFFSFPYKRHVFLRQCGDSLFSPKDDFHTFNHLPRAESKGS